MIHHMYYALYYNIFSACVVHRFNITSTLDSYSKGLPEAIKVCSRAKNLQGVALVLSFVKMV